MRYRISEISSDQHYGVDYIENWNNEGPKIGVWQGHARGGREVSGATLDPESFLTSPHRSFLQKTNCEWFTPYIKRLAQGEKVDIEDIKKTYKENNGGGRACRA